MSANDNSVTTAGGALYLARGTATLNYCTFTKNSAELQGMFNLIDIM
jgi:hypothetical protein